jgi:hypothetical protein
VLVVEQERGRRIVHPCTMRGRRRKMIVHPCTMRGKRRKKRGKKIACGWRRSLCDGA